MSMMRIVTALALLAASALAYTVPPNSTRTTANGTTITTGATAVEVTEHAGWDSITGDGAEITCPGTAHVDGDNNEVNLEDYSLVVVQGDNNDVNLKDNASGDVHGDGNDINHDENTPGSTDGWADGSGNTVNNADSVQQTGPNQLHSQRTNA